MTTFVDTDVLLSFLNEEEEFHEWAKTEIEARKTVGPLIICDIVYSELSAGMDSIDDTNQVITSLALERLRFSNEALYHAGQAYREHRRRGGQRSNVLSDFLIGAQAELEGAPLMTNNVRDYASYFPNVAIIHPPRA